MARIVFEPTGPYHCAFETDLSGKFPLVKVNPLQARESGQWKGKSFFSGGRKPLRDALYMPALVAMRFNPDLKAKYNALRQAGKPAELAIVAIMRKLLETANAPVKADRLQAPKCP